MKPRLRAGIRVGEWRVEPLRGVLVGPDDEKHHLKPKVMDVLLCLGERAGQPVTRDELIECVWGESGVSDEVLTKAISELRHALADTTGHPRYIETIPKRGYRLIAPVSPATGQGTDRLPRSLRPYLLVGILMLVFGISLFLLSSPIDDDPGAKSPVTVIPPNSVAILPFSTRSNVAEDAIFAAGLQDNLVTLLTRLRSLDKVISSTSSARYADTNKSLRAIGDELGVATILTGSLQRVDDTVRINIRLVNASDNSYLWSEYYDQELTVEQIFAIQTEIAREVVAALHGVFPAEDEQLLAGLSTDSIEAYREYVLGRAALARRTGNELVRARAHFEKAAFLDPQYAAAWTGLADVYNTLPEYAGVSEASLVDQRESAINMALAIDPLSGDAYANLANLYVERGQSEQAEQLYLRAIELAPNYATAHHWYALFLRDAGRIELALVHISKALDIDPFAPVLNSVSADIHMAVGYHGEAESILLRAIERDPDFATHYASLGGLRMRQGRFDLALLLIERSLALNPTNTYNNASRCYALLNLGDEAGVADCVRHVTDSFPALEDIYLGLHGLFQGRFDEALAILGRSDAHLSFYAYACTLVGRNDDASVALDRLDPYFDPEAPVGLTDLASIYAAMAVARLLYIDGRIERANEIFDAVLQWQRDPLPVHFAQYIHLTRGHTGLAKDALSNAHKRGLTRDWWYLRTPVFRLLHTDPDWVASLDAIEARMERQHVNYRKMRADSDHCITCL